MSIKINIHKIHRQFTNGLDVVEVDGKNVGECLNNLIKKFPAIKNPLFKKNKLSDFIEIYLNMESAYPDELKKPTKDGDVIHITVILAGG
jgi:molybdopterin converting factor small subunit